MVDGGWWLHTRTYTLSTPRPSYPPPLCVRVFSHCVPLHDCDAWVQQEVGHHMFFLARGTVVGSTANVSPYDVVMIGDGRDCGV